MILCTNMTHISEFRSLDRACDLAIGAVNSGGKAWEERPWAEACCAGLVGANVVLERREKGLALERTIITAARGCRRRTAAMGERGGR